MIESKFHIVGSGHRCAGCDQEIPSGEEHYSAVFFDGTGESFGRRDFCLSCWSARAGAAVRGQLEPVDAGEILSGDYIAFWRTRRPAAEQAGDRRVRFDPELALEIFRRLEPPEKSAEAEVPADSDAARAEVVEAPGEELEDPRREGPRLYPDQKRNLRFVLSLLLLRKKRLVFEGTTSAGGREVLVLREKEDDSRVHRVENPDLPEEELERVRDGLGELLEMQL